MLIEDATVVAAEEKELLVLAHPERGDVLLLHMLEQRNSTDAARSTVPVQDREIPHLQDCTMNYIGRVNLDRATEQQNLPR